MISFAAHHLALYVFAMIGSWKNNASQKLWDQQTSIAFRGLDTEAAVDLLLALNIARHTDDLLPLHGARLRRTHGRGKKRWSMAVNDRWHIRFDFRKSNAFDVKIVGKNSDEKHVAKPGPKRVAKADTKTPVVHPGRFLRRELRARHLSANRLALDVGVPSGRIIDILNARRAITADTAVRLGRYLGTSAQFWLDLQSQFDIAVVERNKGAEISRLIRTADAA